MNIASTYVFKATADVTDAESGVIATGVTLPKGLVVTNVILKETTKASGGSSTTAAVKAGTTALAAAFSIGGASAINEQKACTVGDLAATDELKVALTGSPTAGKFEVTVVGFVAGGIGSIDANTVSAGSNVATEDPYTPPEKKA